MILNLTQHVATADQIEAGVVEPKNKERVISLLTFSSMPIIEEVEVRAILLAEEVVASGHSSAMIGGAPYLMAPLVSALKAVGVRPLFAFSVRESTEQVMPDGTVRKVNTFRHQGFIEG